MPDARPDVLDFLSKRRSRPAKTLSTPAPSQAELMPILEAGLRVPDHGMLEPWRLVVLRGAALERLALLAQSRITALGLGPDRAEKAAVMFRSAPVIVTVISTPVKSEKVPEMEQVLSAGAVCLSLLNAAAASGWGANWLSGLMAMDAGFLREGFGLNAPDLVAGFIVIGSETVTPAERPRPDMDATVSWLDT